MEIIQTFVNFVFDSLKNPWVIFGFAAQAVFFARVVVQWVVSEKRKQIVVPVLYWYLGIIGSVMICVYAIHRQDIVFIASGFLNFLICTRSLFIHKNEAECLASKLSKTKH